MSFKSYHLEINWDDNLPVYWFDNSPFKTHLMNSLSSRFQYGEKFFIASMKRYQGEIKNPKLKQEVATFIEQEAWHTKVHKQYDNWLESKGYPAEKLENLNSKKIIEFERTQKRKKLLSVTMSLEHNTTVVSEWLFKHPELLEQMHPHFRRVWTWHAIEEIEHKSVAADVLIEFNNYNTSRRLIHLVVTGISLYYILLGTIILLKVDNELWKWRTLRDAFHFFFNLKNGMFIKSFIPFLKFMKSDFHPSQQDHSKLLLKFKK